MVGTGLQRDVRGRALNGVAAPVGVAQRHDFGMGLTGSLSVAFAQDNALCGHQDATHTGIGIAETNGLRGQRERALHVDRVGLREQGHAQV